MCANDVDMWLALARLSNFGKAQKVLNKAREACPTEPLIWIAAAKLQEASGNPSMVGLIVKRGIQSLQVMKGRGVGCLGGLECVRMGWN